MLFLGNDLILHNATERRVKALVWGIFRVIRAINPAHKVEKHCLIVKSSTP